MVNEPLIWEGEFEVMHTNAHTHKVYVGWGAFRVIEVPAMEGHFCDLCIVECPF